jgi:hypothetical protein
MMELAALIMEQHRQLGEWYELEVTSGSDDVEAPIAVSLVPRGMRATVSLKRPLAQPDH